MSERQRIVEVPVRRSEHGNTDNYDLQLRNERLLITEADERQGFGLCFEGRDGRQGHLHVDRDDSGRVTGFRLRVGELTYWDLDGDGRIDGYIGPGYGGHILIGDGFVPVLAGKPGLKLGVVAPADQSASYHYRFQDGQWQRVEGHAWQTPEQDAAGPASADALRRERGA